MFDQILTAVYVLLGIFFVYEFWTGVIMMYYKCWYYTRQGIPFIPGNLPVIGNIVTF